MSDITNIEEYKNRITMLEEQNERLKNWYNEKAGECEELKHQLKVSEKALELACEELDNVEVFDAMFMECDSFYEYFLNKAKEMMKSE